MNRLLLAVPAAALLTTGLLAGCSHPFHAGAAAVVGDDRIPTATLQGMVDRGLAAVPPATTTKPVAADLERNDLTELIQLSVLKSMAASLKVTVTSADIDAAITDAASSSTQDQLEANAAAAGVDKQTLRTYAEVAAYEKAVIVAMDTDPTKLQAAYNSAKASTYEEVHVAHILVATKALADSILAQVKADPSQFAALAMKYSTDTGSKANGGDLGFANRSAYVAEFSNAAFAGKDGTIVGPVKSQYGYHIIKIIQHRTISLAQATPDLKLQLNGDAFVAKFKTTAAGLSISVNPRFGRWVPGGGQNLIGDVEASNEGDLSTPVSPSASSSPTPSAGP